MNGFKEWDSCSSILETKSLTRTPKRRPPARKQEDIFDLERKGLQARVDPTPSGFGFGFSQSRASSYCDNNNQNGYTYSYGNQLEYFGGPYGYTSPYFSHSLRGDKDKVADEQSECQISIDRLQYQHPVAKQPEFRAQCCRSTEALFIHTREHRPLDAPPCSTSSTTANPVET